MKSSEKLPRAPKVTEAPIYERLDNETPKAYELFSIYRDQGLERSIKEVAKIAGKKAPAVYDMAGRNNWTERAAAWDLELDRKKLAGTRKKAIAARETHNEAAAKMIELGLARLAKVNQLQPEEITISEATRLVKEGTDIQREALGIAKAIEVSAPGGAALVVPAVVTVEIIHSTKPEKHG